MDIITRVGVVLNDGYCIDKEVPKKIFKDVLKVLNNWDIEIIAFNEIINNWRVSKIASKFFSINSIDLLLVIEATYAEDNYLVDITKFLNCPIIFLAPPDPLGKPTPLTGSLVGVIQNGAVLAKIGKKVKFIIGEVRNTVALKQLKEYIEIIKIIKRLKLSNIGVIGSRCPGMLDTVYNELELTNQIGPEIVHIAIIELINEMGNIDFRDIKLIRDELEKTKKIKFSKEEILVQSIKIYLATKRIIEKYNLAAIGFKCWPELRDNDICTPCFTLSRLIDEGIMSACEADVIASATMYMLYLLTGQYPYFSDFLKINNKTNEVLCFHCGAASSKLAEKEQDIEYKIHSLAGDFKPGLTVEFPIKSGEVTFARLIEKDSKYKMIAYTGKVIKSDMFVVGNPARIILDKNPEYIINKLIENGSGHHQLSIHGNFINDLELLCSLMNLDFYLL